MAIAETGGTASLAALGVRGANQQVEALGNGISQLLNTAQEVSADTPSRVGGVASGSSAGGAVTSDFGGNTLPTPTDATRGQTVDILA